jgi:hypothetical protein
MFKGGWPIGAIFDWTVVEVLQVYGLQDHHRLVCGALGLVRSWYKAPSGHQNCLINVIPP